MGKDCTRCGYCCSYLNFQYPNTKRFKEFLKARGFLIEEINKDTINALLHSPCKALKRNGTKSTCTIYDNRPEACKEAKCPK